MKTQLATVAFVTLMPWSSSGVPAQTERRGCRAGYAFNVTSDLCELCPSGTFTDSYNWENHCQPCSTCSDGRQLVAACNASSNTVCRCADDHYEHEDGCSLKAGTTRSEVEGLSPILLGISKQIGMEAQKSRDKIDSVAKAVDLLRKDAVSGAYSEELFQAITDKVQTHSVMLGVIIFIVALLFLLLMAMVIMQYRSKLVGVRSRQSGCFGYDSKDQKAAVDAQQLDESAASSCHSDGRVSARQKGKSPVQREHTGSAVNDGTPRAQSKSTNDGMDVESRKTDSGDLAMADSDESPATNGVKNAAARVGVPSKVMNRKGVEAETGIYGNQSEEVLPFIPPK